MVDSHPHPIPHPHPSVINQPIPVAALSKADCFLGLRVRIQPRSWMSVSCVCCVLSGRGLDDGSITRPEESYRVWCECDLATSKMRRPKGFCAMKRKKDYSSSYTNDWNHVCVCVCVWRVSFLWQPLIQGDVTYFSKGKINMSV